MPTTATALSVMLLPAARRFTAVFLYLGFAHAAALGTGYFIAVLSSGSAGRLFPSLPTIGALKYTILHMIISPLKYDLVPFHQGLSYFKSRRITRATEMSCWILPSRLHIQPVKVRRYSSYVSPDFFQTYAPLPPHQLSICSFIAYLIALELSTASSEFFPYD